MDRFSLPDDVCKILDEISGCGYEAYIVGGCVRDLLQDIPPNDYDICTSATPQQVMEIFSGDRIIETGIKHGTVTLVRNSQHYEITTFRIDGEYTDHRRPDNAIFVTDLKLDLSRRDFTMNSLAYNHRHGVIDYFGGVSDIENKVIRAVGDPKLRFEEDELRILRGLRFMATTGFNIEEKTKAEIVKYKKLDVAMERIQVEFTKLLMGDFAHVVLEEYKEIVGIFIPEILPCVDFNQHNPYHIYDVYRHSLKAVECSCKDAEVRFSMLLHDLGKPECYTIDENGVGHFYKHAKSSKEIGKTVLQRLKFSRSFTHNVVTLVEYHDAVIHPNKIKKWLNRVGEDLFFKLLEVKKADDLGKNPEMLGDRLAQLDIIKQETINILEDCQCFSLASLQVTGKDLIAAGVPEGKKIGEVLNFLLKEVIENRLENSKDVLVAEGIEYIS